MAVVRQRSAPPYPLIAFVVLWVISTGAAVYFYMGQSKAMVALEAQNRESADYYRPSDMAALKQVLNERTNTDSAVATLVKQVAMLKDIIGAAPTQSAVEIAQANGLARNALKAAGYPTQTLLEAVNAMHNDLVQKNAALAKAADDVEKTRQAAADTAAAYNTSITAANATIAKLTKENTDLTTGASSLRDTNADQVKANEAAMAALRDKQETETRNNVLSIEDLKNQLAQRDQLVSLLRQQIEDLRPAGGTNVGRESDGTVVRAGSTQNEVYINLGKKDRVTPGLTFAVYDPRLGVRFGTDQDAAGKGGIEVLEVSDSESLCRITHQTPGQLIQPGDLIANPVYHKDRSRVFKFVVAGDFDLDGDGVSTAEERTRLVNMIKSWGGTIEDNVSTQTDFLVVGKRPESSTVAPAGDASQPGSVADARAKTQQGYDEMIVEAKRSSVPILNQNRFLAMIGYYNTTIVR